jgi:hypothetical protein
MLMLIVDFVIVFTSSVVLCSNVLHVRLSVRIGADLDSQRGTHVVRRASRGDWTGPPWMTDGGHVDISRSPEMPNQWKSQIHRFVTEMHYCVLY